MKIFDTLKTSQKITVIFSVFNFISLVLLLLSINVIYFYIWYTDQKEEGLYDMNVNYQKIVWKWKNNIEAFQKYILQKDSIIIPKMWWPLVCSKWVAKKLHNNMELLEEVKNSFFYQDNWKIYFIFSKIYEDIWEVKILFDTTPYIRSQIIIIKISFILILFFLILYMFIGKIIANYALKNLNKISKFASQLDLNTKCEKIKIDWPENDEIKIVAHALNNSVKKIRNQSKNQKQFITDVSHEFKTPLMVINSQIDVYYKKCDKWLCGEKDIIELLWKVKKNTYKLNKLLETLFLISRFWDWIVTFKKKKVLLSEFIENISQEIIDNWEKKCILKMKIQKNIFKHIENSTFTIILENLLTNAIKFSDIWNTITVGLNEKKLWIQDNWIWISQQELEKVFHKFYRKDMSIEGFWVWLFMVQRIVNLYGWKITLESVEWEWSTFTILF